MSTETKDIRIEWDGPYSLTDIGYDKENMNYTCEAKFLNNEYKDFGILE